MSQYISRKSDATNRPATQVLSKDKWATVEVENQTSVVAKSNSVAGAWFACYLNIETPAIGGASEAVIRWVRDPNGINDATGYETKTLKKGGTTFVKDVWMFQAKAGQPVELQIKVNGKATIKTREIKLVIP